MTHIEESLKTIEEHQDAVERFLALYDLYRYMVRARPSVADAARIDAAMLCTSRQDRDLNVRAWARYFHGQIWGKPPLMDKPYLPRQWELLIVEPL